MNVNSKIGIALRGKLPELKAKEKEEEKKEPEKSNVQPSAPKSPENNATQGSDFLAEMNKEFLVKSPKRGDKGNNQEQIDKLKLEFEAWEDKFNSLQGSDNISEKIRIIGHILEVAGKICSYFENEPIEFKKWQEKMADWQMRLDGLQDGKAEDIVADEPDKPAGKNGVGEVASNSGNVSQIVNINNTPGVKYTPPEELYNIYTTNKDRLMEMNNPYGLVVCIVSTYTIGENGNPVPATWIPLAQYYYNNAIIALATLQTAQPNYLPDYDAEYQLLKDKLNELLG